MEMRKLGRTGIEVGIIGFGGIPIQRVSEEKALSIIKAAKREGMNFIDTARGYSNSEELIGKGIEGQRGDWIIATKSTARDYLSMKKDIEISLHNLRTNWIDLYQLHLIKTKEDYEKVMSHDGAYRALKEAQEAGLIKEIGITSHNIEILEMTVETDDFSTIQFPYNIVENQGEELFKRAYQRNIGVIVMKPLAGGALTEGSLALRYIMENPYVSVIIPGMDSEEQVVENSRVGNSYTPLKEKEKARLQELKESLGNQFCRRCGYCLPCPQGIDIPTNIIMEGYYTRYELKDWAKERYSGLPKKASDCALCGACEPRCPYNLPIREIMTRIRETFKIQ
ncbi:aldo/keto reductase [Alkaliphilus serpentinus]|uniref:Aldo/keto reductase n=1 Tax=Alkaliphilus serpentinus TaxID=1482731 RepID=A0A833HR51_9FIRM|nr:aldo/keto reductase [Alkaliphilus serpentinus]KAB3532885.1 aldo/keto reductase [Alkaliphilus serpentinus]